MVMIVKVSRLARQKIIPHIWFATEAKEASEFYVSAFGGDSAVETIGTLHGTPSDDMDWVTFRLLGHEFMAISAGPLFKPNPSISFFVNFDPSRRDDAREALDALWKKLATGGTVNMPLQEYPFSKRYGWIDDKYGVSWQLILADPEGDPRPQIVPSLMYVSDSGDVAEDATNFYLSVFKDAKRGLLARYPAETEMATDGAIMYTDFTLEGQWFAAMDGKSDTHQFSFNEAVSLLVYCEDQDEIDYYWNKLSAVPEAEECGWIKDKYGVSWQVVPRVMDEMLVKGTPEQVARVTRAFLEMKKINLDEIQQAYEG